ncbi:uncharacterized protein EV154DRAFT_446766 [Mucor mucedo]|uniref:uncharacterized protein n=1 Tax=Mucor mucedo TaxID=29922 RepID=UPI00221F6256|nr:uncharacterized protein EV154DRAFT_446766 [Mucor mucedo]KAI7889173.1 hypothetical protein EV154DRAFT_446766 [Mucor mucedo]
MRFSVASLASLISLMVLYVNALTMQPTFRDSNFKNIALGVGGGGSSHHNWVLSIVDLLGQRGHNISYLTTTEDLRFGQPYHNIRTIDLGPRASFDLVGMMRQIIPGEDILKIFPKGMEMMNQDYERDYFSFLKYFKSNMIDVVLCDHFLKSCVDAATTARIPYIVTAATEMTKESSAPYINNNMFTSSDFTTEFQSFSMRFNNKFIRPWITLYRFYPYVKLLTTKRRAIGIDEKLESPEETWRNSLKLVNSLFGFTPARPIGPLAEFVGPIIPKEYTPLSNDLENYLNLHKRVGYISFGQNAVPSDQNIELILTSLLESLEGGTLDGFLWATVNSAEFFPQTITTSSGLTYDIKDMFNHVNPHARMVKWAPQTAVLLHPSVSLFVSHGGLGSWYESMYAGTPMIMFPFFGDQPGNSLMIERGGLGGILKYDTTIEEAVELFKNVTEDKDGKIRDNVNRMQALTQIHSEHGIIRGADLVEEVAYTHKDGKLPHRQSADKRMSFIKSHNIDLYAALSLMITVALTMTSKVGLNAYAYFVTKKTQVFKSKQT